MPIGNGLSSWFGLIGNLDYHLRGFRAVLVFADKPRVDVIDCRYPKEAPRSAVFWGKPVSSAIHTAIDGLRGGDGGPFAVLTSQEALSQHQSALFGFSLLNVPLFVDEPPFFTVDMLPQPAHDRRQRRTLSLFLLLVRHRALADPPL